MPYDYPSETRQPIHVGDYDAPQPQQDPASILTALLDNRANQLHTKLQIAESKKYLEHLEVEEGKITQHLNKAIAHAGITFMPSDPQASPEREY